MEQEQGAEEEEEDSGRMVDHKESVVLSMLAVEMAVLP